MTASAEWTSEPFTTLTGFRKAREQARLELAEQLGVDPHGLQFRAGCFRLESLTPAGAWWCINKGDKIEMEDRMRLNRHASPQQTFRLVGLVQLKEPK